MNLLSAKGVVPVGENTVTVGVGTVKKIVTEHDLAKGGTVSNHSSVH